MRSGGLACGHGCLDKQSKYISKGLVRSYTEYHEHSHKTPTGSEDGRAHSAGIDFWEQHQH